MTSSAKRLLAIGGSLAALPLLAALAFRHPRSQAAPAAPEQEATPDPFAEARNRVPRLSWSPKRVSAPTGLCGTEIPRADSGRGSVPAAFRDLTASIPTPEAVAEAADFWLGDDERAIDVADLSARGAEIRADMEREVRTPLHKDAELTDWQLRIAQLDELGRSDEALRLATAAHDRWRSAETAHELASTLLHADRFTEARTLVESELARGTAEPETRSWMTLIRGYACSQTKDFQCADASTSALASSATEPWMSSFLAGYSQASHGRFAEARDAYQQSLDRGSPDDFTTLNNIADAATCLGDRDVEARWAEAAPHAETHKDIGFALAGVGYAYFTQGDAARAWIYGAGALASVGEGGNAGPSRLLLALTALSLSDLAEARRQIQPAAGSGSQRDPLINNCFVHPAEADSLRALIAEARGDTNAAKLHWINVVKSGHPVLGITARHALGDLCPET